jgi:putative transcriptional regulator
MKDKTNFNRIMDGLTEVVEIEAGRARPARTYVPERVDVKAIRGRLHMSQSQFADHFGFTKATVQGWEQNRRQPEASARILLTVIDREPEAVARALGLTA